MGKFGPSDSIQIVDAPYDAATIATDRVIFQLPRTAGASYYVQDISSVQTTASTSGTVLYRVIRSTDTAAPGAAASATVIELNTAVSTASTAGTPTSPALVSGVLIHPGDRIARKTGGTQTNLVGYTATITLAPANEV